MKKTLIILNIAGLIGTLIWLMSESGWEPLITSIGLVGTLIAQLANNKSGDSVKMSQKGGKNSTNYQAKGDIKISNNDK